ncbi:MAG: glycosyltransferase, partial [Pirellulales bacterium]
VWQGNRAWVGDRYRSLPLAEFEPLANVPEARLVSLQKGPGAEQLVSVAGHFPVIDLGVQVDGAAGALMDTAAIMRHLDLVVTSDTAIAHLAGALAVPVWVVLPYAADWRWMTGRCDTPWYPTMRLFRQTRPGDWKGVFQRVEREMRRLSVVRRPSSVATDQGPRTADSADNPKSNPGAPGENPKSYDVLKQAIAKNGARQPEQRSNAINLTCPINQLGYGVVGLNVLKALSRTGREVACWPIGRIDAGADDRQLIEEAIERQKRFDGRAPSIRIAHQNHLAEHVGSPRIGFPIFELDQFTQQELNHLRNQDRLLVTCQWAKEIVESCGALPESGLVGIAPLGVDRTIFHEPLDDVHDRPRTTVFLSVGKWERRKGHDLLLEAFNKAFGPQDDVELWMLTFNPVIGNDRSATMAKNQQWESLYKSCPLAEKIRILPRLADQREVAATMRRADCGVFLSRAEGWNLPLLEMMSCGRQVIATNYSAHTEYCDSSNALLVQVDQLEDAYDERWFSGQG